MNFYGRQFIFSIVVLSFIFHVFFYLLQNKNVPIHHPSDLEEAPIIQKLIGYEGSVFFTIVQPGQLHELRELVGSIHRYRVIGSQKVPIIYIYGWRLLKRETQEISLWRNVIFQDLQNVLFPFGIFDESTIEKGFNSKLDQKIFTENDPKKSLQRFLMKILVEMHGHAIFMKVGFVFWKDTMNEIERILVDQGSISLFSQSNGTVLEGYIEESKDFKCLIISTWNPTIKCPYYTSPIPYDCQDFEIDVAIPLLHGELEKQHTCHICIREDVSEQWQLFKDHRKLSKKPGKRVKIGLAFPTTSKTITEFWDLPFLATFLPSFVKSLTEEELERFEFLFYIGFDEGDKLYDDKASLGKIADKTFEELNRINFKDLRINFVKLGISKSVTFIWNVLYSMAIDDGCQYFYQLNDDIYFQSKGWLQTFVTQLKKRQGYGVVGPNDPAFKCKIMTQTMVTQNHYKLFGWYFPPEIRNWHCDTWISLVYEEEWSKCFDKMLIWNGRYGVDKYTPRYRPCKGVEFIPIINYYKKFNNITNLL